MKKLILIMIVIVLIISLLTVLFSCSSESSSSSSSTTTTSSHKCYSCGKSATKKWRDGKWYCSSCYKYCEAIYKGKKSDWGKIFELNI